MVEPGYALGVRPLFAEAARYPATYQDVLDAPENVIAELIDGALYLQPRPAKPHTLTASVLGMQLGSAFHLGRGGPGGWWTLDEPEIHLDADVLVPDLAGWRRVTTPAFDPETAFYTERPEWVAEVLSPSTARRDRLLKLDVYGRAGVGFAWLVDPGTRSIEVYQLDRGAWVRRAWATGEDPTGLQPFDEVPLDLRLLWVEGATGGPDRPSR